MQLSLAKNKAALSACISIHHRSAAFFSFASEEKLGATWPGRRVPQSPDAWRAVLALFQ
jgi:hypothetical protein